MKKNPHSGGTVDHCNSLPRGLETLSLEVFSAQLGKALDHLIQLLGCISFEWEVRLGEFHKLLQLIFFYDSANIRKMMVDHLQG